MIGQVDRLEDLNRDLRALGIQDQRRIAEAGTPTGIDQPPADVAVQPATVEAIELMMVRATRGQGSVRRQPVWGAIRCRRATALAVCIHLIPPVAQVISKVRP